jgi:hypothetical protein
VVKEDATFRQTVHVLPLDMANAEFPAFIGEIRGKNKMHLETKLGAWTKWSL